MEFLIHGTCFWLHSFVFNTKKASLNSFSNKGLSLRAVAMFGRYDSKFVLMGGILSARWEPAFIKNLLNVSAIIFISVISCLLISKLLGIYHYIFWILLLQPSWHSKCFWYCFYTVLIYFKNKTFLTVFLTSQTNFYIFYMFRSFYHFSVFHLDTFPFWRFS